MRISVRISDISELAGLIIPAAIGWAISCVACAPGGIFMSSYIIAAVLPLMILVVNDSTRKDTEPQ